MKLITISELCRTFHVTTRMLRYYDEIGLLSSTRKEDYAYRVYDEAAVRRLQQILTLRKLRVPLKKIAIIFNSADQMNVLEVLEEKKNELDEELSALQTIRDILQRFTTKWNAVENGSAGFELFHDEEIIRVMQTLSLSHTNLKEEHSMEDLNKANEILTKLQRVRIVLLPPCTVASYHFVGENPEEAVGEVMDRFVRESGLYERKPDSRLFGFNHPNPTPASPQHGYEDWVMIPDEMEVPAPLVKKTFGGGMYAAHTIMFPDFQEWELLCKWVEESEAYCANYSELGGEIMGGCLEEHLNWIHDSHLGWPDNGISGQIDLLLPIKKK